MELYPESPKLELLRCLAWLHDIIEDCEEVTQNYLYHELLPYPSHESSHDYIRFLVDGVVALTKRYYDEEETEKEYLERCALHSLARKVKKADILFNLQQNVKENNTQGTAKYANKMIILVGKN